MSKVTEFTVEMPCEGCSTSITRILKKMDKVENVECDLPNSTVKVTGDANEEEMLKKLKTWGESADKKVELKK